MPGFRLRHVLTLLLPCWLLLLTANRTGAQAPDAAVLSEDAFWQLIAVLQTDVATLQEASLEERVAYLGEAAVQLEEITAVTRQDGANERLSLSVLTKEMRAEEPDLLRIDALLQALLDAREGLETAVFTSADADRLAQILEQEEYRYDREPTWLEQRWEQLLERINEWLARVFPNAGATAGDIAGILILVVSTIILAVVLYYIFSDLLTDFVADVSLPDEDEAGLPLTADTALQRAQELSGEGDYRTAVRYLYLSALLLLEERGLLRYDRSLTNREYLRQVAHRPDLARVLADVVDIFDRVWYGYQKLDGEAYQHYQVQVETLKRQRAS